MRKELNAPYSEREKAEVVRDLGITLINGMVNSRQAAQILSKRAEIETGVPHIYNPDAIRRRAIAGSPGKRLRIAGVVNIRMNLFDLSDVFSLDLEPQKWHSNERKEHLRKLREKKGIVNIAP